MIKGDYFKRAGYQPLEFKINLNTLDQIRIEFIFKIWIEYELNLIEFQYKLLYLKFCHQTLSIHFPPLPVPF